MNSKTVVATRHLEANEAHGNGTLRDILHVVFKYKGVIVLFFLGAVSTVTIVNTFFTKTEYQATTQLLLSPDREQVANLTLSPGAAQPSGSRRIARIANTAAHPRQPKPCAPLSHQPNPCLIILTPRLTNDFRSVNASPP